MGVPSKATLASPPGPATPESTPSSRKRKRASEPVSVGKANHKTSRATFVISEPGRNQKTPVKKAKTPKTPKLGDTDEEKRLRKFRAEPPQSFHGVYSRATTQRFYVLSRTRRGTEQCPSEDVELTGSTGNIYTVTVAQQPKCSCPHGRAGNQCKHMLYVLSRVLRARFALVYQLALLSSELQEIFAGAPPILDETAVAGADQDGEAQKDPRRKPIEEDCPICFSELVDEKDDNNGGGGHKESIVWCRAACGQNIHKECFEMWAATKRQSGPGPQSEVTCPFCRSVWEGDEDMVKRIKNTGQVGEEGYVNVADQLGISTERDTSSYSRWWSGHQYRRQYRHQYRDWDEDDEDYDDY